MEIGYWTDGPLISFNRQIPIFQIYPWFNFLKTKKVKYRVCSAALKSMGLYKESGTKVCKTWPYVINIVYENFKELELYWNSTSYSRMKNKSY